MGVVQTERGKMLKKILEQRVGKTLLIGPLGIAENAVQRIRVGLFNAAHGRLESKTNIGAFGTDILPMTAFRDLKTVIFRKGGIFLIPVGLLQRGGELLIIDIGKTLKKQKRKNIGFKIRRIHRPAQNICGLPQMPGKRTGILIFRDESCAAHGRYPLVPLLSAFPTQIQKGFFCCGESSRRAAFEQEIK